MFLNQSVLQNTNTNNSSVTNTNTSLVTTSATPITFNSKRNYSFTDVSGEKVAYNQKADFSPSQEDKEKFRVAGSPNECIASSSTSNFASKSTIYELLLDSTLELKL